MQTQNAVFGELYLNNRKEPFVKTQKAAVCACFRCCELHAGVAYTSGMYCLRRGADGHLNPAVTVALTVLRRLSVARCVSFLCAQFLGRCSSYFSLETSFPYLTVLYNSPHSLLCEIIHRSGVGGGGKTESREREYGSSRDGSNPLPISYAVWERCELPQWGWGRAPTALRFYTIFSTQDGVS